MLHPTHYFRTTFNLVRNKIKFLADLMRFELLYLDIKDREGKKEKGSGDNEEGIIAHLLVG